jgi:hypothetical protein
MGNIYTKKFENWLNYKITAMCRAMITMHHPPCTLHPTPRTWEGLLPLLIGQTPSPENHAKLLFTTNWNSQWSQAGQHTIISKYRSLVHMSSYIGTFFMWNQISACFIFTWPEKLYHSISLCNLPGSCVLSNGTYRYWTGKCYLSSRFHLKLISGI